MAKKTTGKKKTTKKTAKKPSARLTLARVNAKLDALEKRLDRLEDRLGACEADLTELYDDVFGDVDKVKGLKGGLSQVDPDEFETGLVFSPEASFGEKWMGFWGYIGEKLRITKASE